MLKAPSPFKLPISLKPFDSGFLEKAILNAEGSNELENINGVKANLFESFVKRLVLEQFSYQKNNVTCFVLPTQQIQHLKFSKVTRKSQQMIEGFLNSCKALVIEDSRARVGGPKTIFQYEDLAVKNFKKADYVLYLANNQDCQSRFKKSGFGMSFGQALKKDCEKIVPVLLNDTTLEELAPELRNSRHFNLSTDDDIYQHVAFIAVIFQYFGILDENSKTLFDDSCEQLKAMIDVEYPDDLILTEIAEYEHRSKSFYL